MSAALRSRSRSGEWVVRRLPAVALPLVVLLGLVAPVAQAQPGRSTSPDPASVAARADRSSARHTLREAQRLFSASPSRPSRAHDPATGEAAVAGTPSHDPIMTQPDPTLLLLALRRSLPALSPAERVAARGILSRPTDGAGQLGGWTRREVAHSQTLCGDHVCVHWTSVGDDEPADVDKLGLDGTPGPDTYPDQVDETLHEMTTVWDEEVGTLGYRAPKTDARPKKLRPVDRRKFDVYLSDVGRKHLYGFCSPEQNQRRSTAYCVLDNDFAPRQFGRFHTALQDLQVTAAHEFFHAIQFNYDAGEDAWFMEASAAWIEDVVYPTVNDNLQYLANSPISRPWQPADIGGSSLAVYGSWVWLRYLTDRFGIDLVHRAWTLAAGPRYSLAALALALPGGPASFARLFADFAAANTAPRAFYAEGGRYSRYTARADLLRRLGRGHATLGWRRIPGLRHLTAATLTLVPDPGAQHLALRVRTPAGVTSPQVRLVTSRKAGGPVMTTVPVHHRLAHVVVGFSPTTVTSVRVVVVNASRRTRCGVGSSWSCRGRPLDDSSTFSVHAALVSQP